jgi:hypothetical protein
MVQVARRAGLTDSALVRLLARLTEYNPRESAPAFADRLSDWLRWTDAMSLFTALQDGPAAAPSPPKTAHLVSDRACERVREALAQALADDSAHLSDQPLGRAPRSHLAAPATLELPVDFSPYRRHYQDSQIAMETAIAPVRAQLRARLAATSPDMARLAQVDTVMEQVLAPHERRLLSTLPALLNRRFDRERDAARAAVAPQAVAPQADSPLGPPLADAPLGAPGEPVATTPGAHTIHAAGNRWQHAFRQDLHAVLQAELELRWQPIAGLLATLAHETA